MVSKIAEKIYLIETLALGQRGTVAAYLLKGSKSALVDCGYATSYQTVLEGIKEAGISPSELDYVIPTHVHLDHAGAAGHLLKAMGKAKVIAQERGVPHLVDPTRLVQSATSVFGEELISLYGTPTGIDKERITPVGEEMHLDLGGLTLTAIHAPGHAPHQLSVFVEEGRVLLAADAVGIVYPDVPTMIPTTPPPSLDPQTLGKTTEKLAQLDPRLLLVPHYGTRPDTQDVLSITRQKTNAWVEKARTMRNRGSGSLEEVARALKIEVASESRFEGGVAQLPPHADIAVTTSAMGILHYLEKTGST